MLPAPEAGPLRTALLRAALLGLIAYGTYYLMNEDTPFGKDRSVPHGSTEHSR